jgi:hypothetical protein
MVKNVKGGNRGKSGARKNMIKTVSNVVRLPECELEQFAVVTKHYGTVCDVTTSKGLQLKCQIRGKFKKNISHHFIAIGKFVLVGLREWESVPKSCDLLHVYENNHIINLNNPLYDLSNIIGISLAYGNHSNEPIQDDVLFTHDAVIREQVQPVVATVSTELVVDDIDYDFDDI